LILVAASIFHGLYKLRAHNSSNYAKSHLGAFERIYAVAI